MFLIPGIFPIRRFGASSLSIVALAALFTSAASFVHAQHGSLRGTVVDEKTKEPLSGANVFLLGTTLGASTDLDGAYGVTGILPGVYNIRISFLGYSTKIIAGVAVEAGVPVQLNAALAPVGDVDAETFRIEDLVVTAEKVLSTSAAVLAERMKAATIGDGISAKQISMSPDATSGDALKRITGLSVVDNKYVFIRGVTDRYNGTMLNGVSISSTDTDVDKKSFSFDLIPSNLLANTVVVKTASPDLPGDFSGGLVQVNTLEFPPERLIKLSLSSSYHSKTTWKEVSASQGGGTDWLGYDDGSRTLPGGLQGNSLARKLPNTWSTQTRDAPLNESFNVAAGDRFSLFGDEVGAVGAFTYKSGFEKTEFLENPSVQGVDLFKFEGQRFTRSILWGGLLNVNYKPASRHKVSFKNNYVRSAQETVSLSKGFTESAADVTQRAIEWDQRSLFLSQLSGEHSMESLSNLKFAWKGFYSASQAEEPDRKYVIYAKNAYGNDVLSENYRTWSDLEEASKGFDADLSVSLGSSTFKFGVLSEGRTREFTIDAFYTDASTVKAPNWNLLVLPIDTIFSPDNYGEKKFTFRSVTDLTGRYDGADQMNAYYAMLDCPFNLFGMRLRGVGGARVEDWRQTINSIESLKNPDPVESTLKKTDVLPSMNLTYAVTPSMNLRLAYSQSVNRPEMRERANVKYFDFNMLQNVKGQPALRRALIRNYDVRLELFPGQDEVLAVSGFYKYLRDPIEIKLETAPDRYRRTWFNSPKGNNYGWEFELRKSLGFIGDYFEQVMFGANYTRVWSAIEYTRIDETIVPPVLSQEEREMQGQSPWTINLSLFFFEPHLGTSCSVLYNRVARRLYAIADVPEENVYEESRGILDMAISQNLPNGLTAKFAVKDLTAEDQELTFLPERVTFSRIARGTSYSLSLSYSF